MLFLKAKFFSNNRKVLLNLKHVFKIEEQRNRRTVRITYADGAVEVDSLTMKIVKLEATEDSGFLTEEDMQI